MQIYPLAPEADPCGSSLVHGKGVKMFVHLAKKETSILENTFVITNQNLELSVALNKRDHLGACGTGGVGVQKCPGSPFTSWLTFILLAPLLLLS